MILSDEQIISVIHEHGCGPSVSGKNGDCHTCRAVIRATERTVLERLRDATTAMLESAGTMGGYDFDRKTADADYAAWQRAMIDAALRAVTGREG